MLLGLQLGLQGVGSQAFNMGQAINQQQMQQGAMQQQLMQNLINAARRPVRSICQCANE